MNWNYLKFCFQRGWFVEVFFPSCFKYRLCHQKKKKSHTLTEWNYFWFRKKWTHTRKDTHLEHTGNAIQVLWVGGSSYFSQVIILLLPFYSQTFADCSFNVKHFIDLEQKQKTFQPVKIANLQFVLYAKKGSLLSLQRKATSTWFAWKQI